VKIFAYKPAGEALSVLMGITLILACLWGLVWLIQTGIESGPM
jgi:hypothetical protein